MTTINILGSCICRDIFRINPCGEKYKINKFIQSVSPVSIVGSPSSFRLDKEDLAAFAEWSDFTKRNVCADFNKTVIPTIAENPADYLILDLCELRFKHALMSTERGDKVLVTKSKYTIEILEKQEKPAKFKSVRFENADLSDQEVLKALDLYIAFIAKYYQPDRIILIKNYPTYRLLDDEKHDIYEYPQPATCELTHKLSEFYSHFEKSVPGVHIIEMPEHYVGYAQHLWGRDPLHFTDRYYRYLFRSIGIITDGEFNARDKIAALREEYSLYFELLEKQKRMEYYIIGQNGNANLLKNADFSHTGAGVPGWEVTTSSRSEYNVYDRTLKCGAEKDNWAVLSQPFSIFDYAGKTLTFSVKFVTVGDSVLNIALRLKKTDGQWAYPAIRQVMSRGREGIDFTTAEIPADLTDVVSSDFCIYLNKPQAEAAIIEAKLEYGKISSLF